MAEEVWGKGARVLQGYSHTRLFFLPLWVSLECLNYQELVHIDSDLLV